jgi:hypothetical protein
MDETRVRTALDELGLTSFDGVSMYALANAITMSSAAGIGL